MIVGISLDKQKVMIAMVKKDMNKKTLSKVTNIYYNHLCQVTSGARATTMSNAKKIANALGTTVLNLM